MRCLFALTFLFGCLLGFSGPAPAQVAPTDAAAAPEKLRVFLDCPFRCDVDYLRTEITFVDYVRNREDADVHILVTTRGTGAGGTEFAMRFVGRRAFIGVDEDLVYATVPGESQDLVRQGMGRVLSGGLVRYALRTPLAQRMRLSFEAPPATRGVSSAARRDPWNAWVFRTSVGASLNGEASYKSHNLNASASASRTTAAWKSSLSVNGRTSRSDTRVGERWVTNEQNDYGTGMLVVRSINEHWSIGGRTGANHSTFQNRDLSLRLAPAIEYNVFPYSESTRRQLVVQYTAGASRIQYLKETIFDKMEETLADQTLSVALDTRQRWGSARAEVAGAHYFHDLSKYRLEANGGIDVRLIRGLAVNLNASTERIHNQLYLVKGTLTPEQILLRQRQIATAFRYNGSLGLSYSFGSIFNSVVNPRFN
ncbi:MAG: hypothetical protein KY464_05765 [Gemmatimonadetes bacterium]|nr:hypothetical protein [Gemmatimonadota bacterium]